MKCTLTTVLLSAALVPPVALGQQGNVNQQQAGGQGQAGSHTQQQQRQQQQQQQQNAVRQVSAEEFVAQAASSNLFEIQSSQLALERSENEQVREFAQRMLDDHTAATQQLQQAAQGQRITQELNPPHQQLMQQLQQTQGEEFDARYLQIQQQAHREAIALFEGMTQSGQTEQQTKQLNQFAQQTLPTLREHLKMVQDIGQKVAPDMMAQNLQGQQEQDPSRIVVERDAPRVQVEQSSPRITVQQARPDVSVSQAQPELIVHQPQPTVTVDIPHPQITIRMPQPQVQVSQAKPEVQVEQAQPQVEVQQNERPQVQVEAAQPVASVRGPENPQPQINYQQGEGQPTIRYEREEPKIVVNREEGEPQVRVERLSANDQNAQNRQNMQNQESGQPAAAGAGTAANPETRTDTRTEDDRGGVSSRTGMDDEVQEQRLNRDNAEMREISVGDIKSMDVYNAEGEQLGDVTAIVQGAEGQQYVIMSEGGFFGIGEDTASLPVDRFWVQGDHLVVHGVTRQDIEAMDDYRDQSDQYQELDDDSKAPIGVWQ